MQQLLILGGTQFIGRNLVERLIGRDDLEITLFNRQKTNSELFPSLRKLKGDRATDDVALIGDQHWDYVIDLSCYYPDSLDRILKTVNKDLKKYILISTCSVYDMAQQSTPLASEAAPLFPCTPQQRSDETTASYGARKAECERILQSSGVEHLILRPALVYGRYDHTDRFYYWLHQVRHYPQVLLPDNGLRSLSLTYVHDLVEVITQALSTSHSNKVYNVISTPLLSIRQIVELASSMLDKEPDIINATGSFLHVQGVSEWTDMPLWIDNDTDTFSNQLLKEDFEIELTQLKIGVAEAIHYFEQSDWPQPKYGMDDVRKQQLIDKLTRNG